MFIVRLVAWLISLPLLWAGQLASLLKLPVAVPLLEAAWRIGGDGYVANAILANCKRQESTEAAIAKANEWLSRRPQPQIAAFAGILALNDGNIDSARQMLVRGRELGDDQRGLLDLLEAGLVLRSDDKTAVDELVGRWASRRDLAPSASEFVLEVQLWDSFVHWQWQELERRAKHLWSIRNHPMAAVGLWAVDRQQGRNRNLRIALEKIGVSQSETLSLMAQAFNTVGETAEAEQAMLALQQVDPALAERTRRHLEQQERTA